MSNTQPEVCCKNCGKQYGKKARGIATWHMAKCVVCNKFTAVTEARDFGYLSMSWIEHNK